MSEPTDFPTPSPLPTQTMSPPATTPQLVVRGRDGSLIMDGQTETSAIDGTFFGSFPAGEAYAVESFSLYNNGTGYLSFSQYIVQGDTEFSLQFSYLYPFPGLPVASLNVTFNQARTTLDVRDYAAEVRIQSNDAENPMFIFWISANVTAV